MDELVLEAAEELEREIVLDDLEDAELTLEAEEELTRELVVDFDN